MGSWKKYFIIFTIFFIVQGFMITVFVDNKNSEINKKIQEQQKHFEATYNTVFESYSVLPKVVFQGRINSKYLTSIIAKASNTKDQEYKDLLREEVYENLIGAYTSTLAVSGFKQLQFHLADGETFLRFSHPKVYGDNLKDTKHSLQEISTLKRPLEGFESGLFLNGYRYLYPLFYKNQFVGSAGITLDIDTYLKIAQKALGGEQRFIIKWDHIFKESLKNGSQKFIRSCLNPSFIYQKRNNINMFNLLHTVSLEKKQTISQKLNSNNPFSVIVHLKESPYIATFLPIYNMQNSIAGFIIGLSQAEFIEEINANFIKNITVSLLSLFLLMLLLLGYFKEKNLLQKLVEHKNTLEEKVDVRTKELRQSSKLLQTILETLPTPVFYKSLDGEYLICNQAFANIANRKKSQILGYKPNDIFSKEITEKFIQSDRAVLSKKKTISLDTALEFNKKQFNYTIYKGLVLKDNEPIGIIGAMHDITNKVESKNNLKDAFSKIKEQQEKLKSDYEIIQKYTIYAKLDTSFHIIEISDGLCDILNCDRNLVIGEKPSILSQNGIIQETFSDIKSKLLNNQSWFGEFALTTKDHTKVWLRTKVTPEYDKNGKITSYSSFSQDISREKIIEKTSYKDELTQLYNRKKFNEELYISLSMFKRYNDKTSLILFDIDKFKQINDTYGHLVGDKILKKLSAIVQENIRECDILARWGGEEFALILPKTDLEKAILTAKKIREKILSCDFKIEQKVTCSFGITTYTLEDTPDSLIKKVDDMLYRAKNEGRDRIIYE